MPSLKRRILCAETHPDISAVIFMLLEKQGHEVKAAKTLHECLELARKEHFDLYMLDDGYTDGTNVELCRQLRKLSPETPILFFSSKAFPRDRQAAMEAGAEAYLTKPMDILEIAEAVNAILLSRAPGASNGESHRQR
jgi:two-component system, OmpR family, KDP operon response regulator KdpE